MEQIHHDQASADFYYLSELIRDYIGLVGAVKEAFQVSQPTSQIFNHSFQKRDTLKVPNSECGMRCTPNQKCFSTDK